MTKVYNIKSMTQRRIYQNECPYFVTFRTREGWPAFEDEKMAGLISREIFVSADLKRFDILAYQIMPDHVHLLAYSCTRTLEKVRLGGKLGGDLGVGSSHILSSERTFSNVRDQTTHQYTVSDLIQSIKGIFSRKIHIGNIWQRRFYTRIVSTHKYLETVIQYIQHNPVKAKLPMKYRRLPYQYFNWRLINTL